MLGFSGVQVMYITLSFLLCSESSKIKMALYRPAECGLYSRHRMCTREYFPVCATDGKTYANKCTYCIAFKESRGSVTFKHFGRC